MAYNVKNNSSMRKKIEEAIRTTLVVENKESIHYTVDKILLLLDVVGRSEQLVCDHPDEAIIRDKPTDYCLACNRNI